MCFIIFPPPVFSAGESIRPLAVKAAMLVETNTGRVLYQQNAHKIVQPASLSKIMSLYLISEDIEKKKTDYSDLVTVSSNAVLTGGSKMLFEPGAQYAVLDLFKGMAIHSANDAAVALAEHFGGSEKTLFYG